MTNKLIPIAKPSLDQIEIDAVAEVIRSGWIMQGNRVTDFEKAFASYVGAEEAIAVSSGTTALHLALYTANCQKGDTVICPSYSFIATANVIRHCGAEPVFVDIDPQNYNLDPDLVEKAIRPDTKAILLVHQVGFPAKIKEISEIAKKHNLIIIEDAACAIGSEYNNEKIGRPHSLAACFSFHPRKIITTGDGGMVTTNSKEFAERARALRQHGIGSSGGFIEVGFNYRLTDLQAALGIEQLKKLPSLLEVRREQAARYTEAFKNREDLLPETEEKNIKSNYQSYQVRLLTEARKGKRLSRDQILQELKSRNITAQPGIAPIHLQKIYDGAIHGSSLEETERAAREVIILPLYHSLTEEEQSYIIETLLQLLD